jgi:hypothetical protein
MSFLYPTKVQTQLHVWNKELCHFVVWTRKSWEIILVPKNPSYAFTLLTVIDYYFSHIVFHLLDGDAVPPLPTLSEARKTAAAATLDKQKPPVEALDDARREIKKFVQAAARGKRQLVLQASSPVPKQKPSLLPKPATMNSSADEDGQAAVACQNVSVPQQNPTSKIPRLKRVYKKDPATDKPRNQVSHEACIVNGATSAADELSPLLCAGIQLSPTMSPALKRFKEQATYSDRATAAVSSSAAASHGVTTPSQAANPLSSSQRVLRTLSSAAMVCIVALFCTIQLFNYLRSSSTNSTDNTPC